MGICKFLNGSLQVQRDERVGLFAGSSAVAEGLQATHRQPGHDRKSQQYPDENESVYHQIADVVPLRGNTLVQGNIRLVLDMGQQLLSGVRIRRFQYYRY